MRERYARQVGGREMFTKRVRKSGIRDSESRKAQTLKTAHGASRKMKTTTRKRLAEEEDSKARPASRSRSLHGDGKAKQDKERQGCSATQGRRCAEKCEAKAEKRESNEAAKSSFVSISPATTVLVRANRVEHARRPSQHFQARASASKKENFARLELLTLYETELINKTITKDMYASVNESICQNGERKEARQVAVHSAAIKCEKMVFVRGSLRRSRMGPARGAARSRPSQIFVLKLLCYIHWRAATGRPPLASRREGARKKRNNKTKKTGENESDHFSTRSEIHQLSRAAQRRATRAAPTATTQPRAVRH